MRERVLQVAAAAVFCLAAAATAMAQAIVSTGESFVSARMLPGERTGPGERLAGLRLSLKPGWKTYWRSPGEAGVPPDFDWSGSLNVKSVEVLWPRPRPFESFGLETLGYAERVVFPLRLEPGRLLIAMRDPHDISAVDEVRFGAVPADRIVIIVDGKGNLRGYRSRIGR